MDLLKGCEYEFRVSAENEVGVGDPSPPSKPIFAKDPIGIVTYGYTVNLPSFDSVQESLFLFHSQTRSSSEPKGH